VVVCWAAGFSWAGGARDSKAHRPLASHGRGNRGQERRPHSAVGSHGGTSSELRRDRAAVHCFQIRGHGEREEEEGFRSGDSGHRRGAGRRPAMDGHGSGSGSSWEFAGGRER